MKQKNNQWQPVWLVNGDLMTHMNLSNSCPSQIWVFPFHSPGPLFIWSRMLNNFLWGVRSLSLAMLWFIFPSSAYQASTISFCFLTTQFFSGLLGLLSWALIGLPWRLWLLLTWKVEILSSEYVFSPLWSEYVFIPLWSKRQSLPVTSKWDNNYN